MKQYLSLVRACYVCLWVVQREMLLGFIAGNRWLGSPRVHKLFFSEPWVLCRTFWDYAGHEKSDKKPLPYIFKSTFETSSELQFLCQTFCLLNCPAKTYPFSRHLKFSLENQLYLGPSCRGGLLSSCRFRVLVVLVQNSDFRRFNICKWDTTVTCLKNAFGRIGIFVLKF